MFRPKSTLEQWRIFQAVVEYGGYAQAAEKLNKSQSSLNHAIAKLQQTLGVALLEVRGRKAYLTDAGDMFLRRAKLLNQNMQELELLAHNIHQGWEAEIRLAVEIAHPRRPLNRAAELLSHIPGHTPATVRFCSGWYGRVYSGASGQHRDRRSGAQRFSWRTII